MNARFILPSRRPHTTKKVGIAGPRLYLPVHGDPVPAELFL